MIFIVETLIPI